MKVQLLPICLLMLSSFTASYSQSIGSTAEKTIINIAGDLEDLNLFFENYSSVVASGDIDAWINHFSEDVIIGLPPDEMVFIGKENGKQWAKPHFDKYKLDEKFTIEEAEVYGKMAFVRFGCVRKITPKTGGATLVSEGKGIWIFKKQSNGEWKASRVTWNNNRPNSFGYANPKAINYDAKFENAVNE